jgi:DNA-binding LacI/PurR family transcriptional regulator
MYSDKPADRLLAAGSTKAAGSADIVLEALYDLIAVSEDGARLPTVRDLMRRYQVSQAVVQGAVGRLRGQGLLTSQVGRGTYVVKGGAAANRAREAAGQAVLDSLLILSNASMNERCVLVQNHIVDKMSRDGSKVVQISYHHTDHLLEILGSIPNFDAAVLQSHYESIPVRLLRLLQQKCKAVVVDGHTVSGVDVDRVGTDWEDALELALRHLCDLGHRSFGMVSLNTAAQPILAVRRAFTRHLAIGREGLEFFPPVTLQHVLHPTQSVCDPLEEALAPLVVASGKLPFTALVTLGISDTLGLTQVLERLGIRWPEQLSLVVLGHRDVPAEHIGAMTISGSSHQEAAESLVETIRRRIANPDLPPQISYLRCDQVVRRSTARLQSPRRRTALRGPDPALEQPG